MLRSINRQSIFEDEDEDEDEDDRYRKLEIIQTDNYFIPGVIHLMGITRRP